MHNKKQNDEDCSSLPQNKLAAKMLKEQKQVTIDCICFAPQDDRIMQLV